MLLLAHLSDVHLPPLPRPRLRDLTPKRLLGLANWHRKRKHQHRRPVIEALIADLRTHRPDHIAVTGDLANIGLPAELEQAARWLRELGPPDHVTVVPGNHDAYVRLSNDPGIARWADYMQPNAAAAALGPPGAGGFPFVRLIGRFALIGLSSAVPTPPLVASGRLGEAQRVAAGRLLERLGQDGCCRIVLIHHPPLPGQASALRGLSDAREVADLLARAGAELVLHGHNHRNMQAHVDHAGGRCAVVGVPSASAGPPGHMPVARYNLLRISPEGDGWAIHLTGRELGPDGRDFVTVEERRLPG